MEHFENKKKKTQDYKAKKYIGEYDNQQLITAIGFTFDTLNLWATAKAPTKSRKKRTHLKNASTVAGANNHGQSNKTKNASSKSRKSRLSYVV